MKKNKILIGVISIMFAGIIILGIIECNNSNTRITINYLLEMANFVKQKG